MRWTCTVATHVDMPGQLGSVSGCMRAMLLVAVRLYVDQIDDDYAGCNMRYGTGMSTCAPSERLSVRAYVARRERLDPRKAGLGWRADPRVRAASSASSPCGAGWTASWTWMVPERAMRGCAGMSTVYGATRRHDDDDDSCIAVVVQLTAQLTVRR